MIITTNHPPKMMECLQERQAQVNAGGDRQRFFYLKTSSPLFGLRALQRLATSGKVEVRPTAEGDALVRVVV
jgi:hypothetical protein